MELKLTNSTKTAFVIELSSTLNFKFLNIKKLIILFLPAAIIILACQNENRLEENFMSDDNRKPNRLINEKSPYLLQHAYNPIDWYPWGEEAFDLAKKLEQYLGIKLITMSKETYEKQELDVNDGGLTIGDLIKFKKV